jgi:polysaccharide export outer membrane protein
MTFSSNRPRSNARLRSVLALLSAAALSLSALSLSAAAQFNGPGPSSTGALNQPQTVTVDTTLLHPVPRDLYLEQGDTLTIHLFGQAEYSPTVIIGIDGRVLLPLIGIVALDHLTITAAEELIASRLRSAGMYKDPQVTIAVTAGPGATTTIIGEAHGVIPITGSRRLLDVLAAAGGLPPSASHVITINRPGVPEPIIVDLGTDPSTGAAANIPIFPGDTIVVSRVGVIYLLGSFKTVGTVALTTNTPLTLMQAASLGGGLAVDAKLNDLRLIRTIGNRRIVVKLNMSRVEYGRDPDPLLQPNDILFMPNSFFKSALTNGEFGSVLSLVSVLFSTLAYVRSY